MPLAFHAADINGEIFRYVCTATNSIGITEKTIEVLIHHHRHHHHRYYIVIFIIIKILSAFASFLSCCHTFDFQVSIVTLPNLESEYRVKKGKNTTIFFIMHDENDGEDVADDDDDDNY